MLISDREGSCREVANLDSMGKAGGEEHSVCAVF